MKPAITLCHVASNKLTPTIDTVETKLQKMLT